MYRKNEKRTNNNNQLRRVENNVDNNEQPANYFLKLNVYCLLEIFKRLQLKEKIRLALSCRGLFNFYMRELAPKHKMLSTFDTWVLSRMDQAELSHFLEATAKFIEEVGISNCNILAPIFRYGTNIKSVNASYSDLKDAHIKQLLQLPKLRILKLEWNDAITGKYLATLTNLEELYLPSGFLLPKYIQEVARCCNKLRILDLRGIKMDIETSHVVGQHCKRLETLRFRHNNARFSDLAMLPNLRKLAMFIRSADQRRLHFLHTLAEHKAEQLEDLRISSMAFWTSSMDAITKFKNLKVLCWEVGHFEESLKMLHMLKDLEKLTMGFGKAVQDEQLLEMLKDLPNLKYLALQRFPFVTEDFVFEAIELLKKRKAEHKALNKPWKPFVLVVYDTKIKSSIIRNEQYLAATSILKVHKLSHCFYDNFLVEFPYDC